MIKLNLYPVYQGHGNITMHLFHSQQKVQLQGGSLMTLSGTTTPRWFYDNIVEGNFIRSSSLMRKDVDSFNTGVTNLSVTLNKTSRGKCAECNSIMYKNSTPTQCSSCLYIFHKSCHTKHNSSMKTSRSGLSSSAITISSTPITRAQAI